MVVLCRIGETQGIANLVKGLVYCIHQEGGVIRQIYNMGDRISDRSYKDKKGLESSIVRYLCFEFDGNPDTKLVAEKVVRNNSESLQVFTHKLKEKDYYKRIFDKNSWKEYSVAQVSPDEQAQYKEEMIDLLAKEKVNLGDNFESEFDKVKNKII